MKTSNPSTQYINPGRVNEDAMRRARQKKLILILILLYSHYYYELSITLFMLQLF
jgi:hypothetical protein